MKISNLKFTKKGIALCLAASMSLVTLTGCNKQVVDFNKAFNVVVEKNVDNISVVGIKEYTDYSGTMVQFVTMDGLVVITSTMQTQLVNAKSEEALDKYTSSLTNDEENIVSYDEMQNTKIKYGDKFNKDLIDMRYSYNKALVVSDDTVTIYEITKWNDYEDDKVQIKLTDGTCILQNADKIKIINDKNAREDSLMNYAISLAGSKDNVITYGAKKLTK